MPVERIAILAKVATTLEFNVYNETCIQCNREVILKTHAMKQGYTSDILLTSSFVTWKGFIMGLTFEFYTLKSF